MKLVILDRDGTINEDRDDYVKSPDEWVPIAGSLEAIARLNQAGWRVVVATNQSGLGRGLFDVSTLNAMHAKFHRLLAEKGGRVDAIFFCPHTPEDNCGCRKPLPGLYEKIRDRYGLESLDGVPCVGDSRRDLDPGSALGCAPHLVLTGKGKNTAMIGGLPKATRMHADLFAFSNFLIDGITP